MRHLFLFAAVFLLFSLPAAAQKEDAGVLSWVQIEKESAISYSSPDGKSPAVPLQEFVSDIHFDPSDLDNSSIIIAAAFLPGQDPEGKDTISGAFKSDKIRRVKGNLFEAEGEMMFPEHKPKIKVYFTASFDKTSAEPKILIDGSFNVMSGWYASGQQPAPYSGQLPVNFRIAAEPLQ